MAACPANVHKSIPHSYKSGKNNDKITLDATQSQSGQGFGAHSEKNRTPSNLYLSDGTSTGRLVNQTQGSQNARPAHWRITVSMRDIVAFALLLVLVCVVVMGISLKLPSPDGAIFAVTILLSATLMALTISVDLGEGRINRAGDIMRLIEQRRSWRMAIPAYLLGWSLVAAMTVLIYRSLS